MKINVDLTALWNTVRQMGAKERSINLNQIWDDTEIDLDAELSTTGLEINLDEIESTEGLLNYRGRQVLLFIPDQGLSIDKVLEDPTAGRKFHVSDCRTLDEMRAKKRFERYKVTNNISGEFNVFGMSKLTNKTLDGEVKLNVCSNCLNKLNYKGADIGTSSDRKLIVKDFDLAEFFSKYSSIFKSMPKQHIREAKKGYTSDWKQVSEEVRKQKNYTCQECKVCLKDNKNLLHTHHINGVKSDNDKNNLQALCADCHRKQDFHQHMYVAHTDIVQLNKLRREQGCAETENWEDAYKIADPACHGILAYCQKKGFSIPEIGYEITNGVGEVIAEVELAWPHKNFAVAIGETVNIDGWIIKGLGEAMDYFSQYGRH